MTFLVLLLVLWVEKFSALRARLQRDGFFLTELARLERTGKLWVGSCKRLCAGRSGGAL